MLLAQRDPSHYRVYKKRRCFLWNNQYFQLDIYTEKNPSKYVKSILHYNSLELGIGLSYAETASDFPGTVVF